VPAKLVYLTDGRSRIVKIGNWTIEFYHASPKIMVTAGRISGLVIAALDYIGYEYVDEKTIFRLQLKLTAQHKEELLSDILCAPVWMRKHIERIAYRNSSCKRTSDA
jgi:hypothetical protein